MSMQTFFSVQKQKKYELKQCQIIENQISNQQLIHTLESPISGDSQSLTENYCFTKINDRIIEEPPLVIQCQSIFSELDNIGYNKQTILFTTMNELKQAIQKIKCTQNELMIHINEYQIDQLSDDEIYQLGIITKIFINHNFIINIRMLSRFIIKVIEIDLSFSKNDIIQYYDESFHINPISLLFQKEKYTCYEALREFLIQMENCKNIQIILEILRDFNNQDLEQLISYNVIDKDIYKLKLQLINILYNRIQI